MRTLFAVGIVLATVVAAPAAYAYEAKGTIPSQRHAAFADCVIKAGQSSNKLSLAGTVGAVAMNYSHALTAWAESSLRAQPDLGCYAFLTTEEREKESTATKDGHPVGSATSD
jgi:hypothetical protein